MNSILSIENARKVDLKQSVKEWVGKGFVSISPSRTRHLFESPLSQPEGFRDKAIMAFLKRQAIDKNQEDFFERLHLDFWKGDGGANFSSNCDHRFHDLFLAKQQADVDVLRGIWEEKQLSQIVEFGCNSGLLLNYLTAELAGVVESIGIEVNDEQVRLNQQSDSFDSRIRFECVEGGEWLLENGQAKTLYVSNGGVLEYFRRERLDQMVGYIARELGPSVFFAVEPVAEDHDWSTSKDSIPFGNELSFSHNYTDLFESNGFEIRHQRSIEFESWQMFVTIAVC